MEYNEAVETFHIYVDGSAEPDKDAGWGFVVANGAWDKDELNTWDDTRKKWAEEFFVKKAHR